MYTRNHSGQKHDYETEERDYLNFNLSDGR